MRIATSICFISSKFLIKGLASFFLFLPIEIGHAQDKEILGTRNSKKIELHNSQIKANSPQPHSPKTRHREKNFLKNVMQISKEKMNKLKEQSNLRMKNYEATYNKKIKFLNNDQKEWLKIQGEFQKEFRNLNKAYEENIMIEYNPVLVLKKRIEKKQQVLQKIQSSGTSTEKKSSKKMTHQLQLQILNLIKQLKIKEQTFQRNHKRLERNLQNSLKKIAIQNQKQIEEYCQRKQLSVKCHKKNS